ncbi:MAG: hypothetical protein KIT89_09505 [Microcella sp.]|uniref:hypothetical protein n=1 Tax=Microcella sp. TaxID=1913979 RepID=UPI0024CB201D|nr:hypothetical protein [Microcella sp.]UYN82941.1 MAG: hypothetical protein KIT89_09505 [Microcella sp.]
MTHSLPIGSDDFERMTAALTAAVREHPALTGLVFLGSSSHAAASRRDEWSDHDFFALAAPGAGAAARRDLDWLPDRERLVLTAREGEIGFVAVYDHGHVLEFALAEPGELAGALAEEATVAVDDDEGSTARLIAQSQARAASLPTGDALNDTRLVLVKLLIGTGRLRRGETINGGQFIRQWAVKHLVLALRARAQEQGGEPAGLEPTRRFEATFPEIAADIEAAIAQPAERAAKSLFELTRRELEPEWNEFPTEAADAIARRLGW